MNISSGLFEIANDVGRQRIQQQDSVEDLPERLLPTVSSGWQGQAPLSTLLTHDEDEAKDHQPPPLWLGS